MTAYRPTPFARSLLEQMRGGGSPLFDDWRDGLHPTVLARAEAAAEQIRLHDSVRARNSSMVFAFNLLLPFVDFDFRLGAPFDDVTWDRVEIEWTPPGHLLGEIDGDVPRDDERATAIDGVLWGRRGGARVVVLVEVKLSEGGFTTCGGLGSAGNHDHGPCRDATVLMSDPGRCYLTRPWRKKRDRRYWPIFEAAHGGLAAAFPGAKAEACPFAGDAQQPMRQHALALALEQEGLADEAWLLLLHHDHNPDVRAHFDAYRALTADPSRLLCWPASTLLAAGPPTDWASWMRHRYIL